MISIKRGAKVNRLQTEMILAVIVANEAYAKYETECVITEGVGGKHGRGSRHYVGYAIDLRTRNLHESWREIVADDIRERLGEQYDVILESDHIHVEFDPKV